MQKAGAATVALRFAAKARRSLVARHQLALKVAVRFTPQGGGEATTQTLALKLKR